MSISWNGKSLPLGFNVSSRAIDTYDVLCQLFGFKTILRSNFFNFKRLYASNATPEGFNVWMIAHNNIIESFNSSRNWFNIIEHPDTIKEVWFDSTEATDDDLTPRICFVKTDSGRYIFFGVYVLVKAGMDEICSRFLYVRTFKRISPTYPLNFEYTVPTHAKAAFSVPTVTTKEHEECSATVTLDEVTDHCTVKALILEHNKHTVVDINTSLRPMQMHILGRKVGDTFTFRGIDLTYKIEEITPT